MERNDIRVCHGRIGPDFASLNPGYACWAYRPDPSPFVPAQAGTQGPGTPAFRFLGPRFRGGERWKRIQLSKSASFIVPRFGRAWGWPVSFPSPQWGEWRAEKAHGLDFARPARSGGRARNAGTLAHMTRAPASSRRATRHLRLYAFNGSVGPARSLCAAGGLPAAARGRGSRSPRSRVPHPAPPLRRLARTPLS